MRKQLASFSFICFFLTGCSSVYLAVDNNSTPVSEDRYSRTLGTTVEDESIETKAYINIQKVDPQFASAHMVAVSFNGTVLLAGQVASEDLKNMAEDVVKKIRRVVRVHNALTVSTPTAGMARANDAWLTTKAKARILVEDSLKHANIKVVTENGVIYLLGFVTKDQAETATGTVRQVYGAQKIVTLFEYVQ